MTNEANTAQGLYGEAMTEVERERFFEGKFPTQWLSGSRGKCYRWENANVFEQVTAEYVSALEARADLAAQLRRSISFAFVSEAAIFRFINAWDALTAPTPPPAAVTREPFEEAP